MPTCTINDIVCEFEDGQTILEVAKANDLEIPHYCWHPGLSIAASCRICLAEVAAPNPRNDGKIETIPKLLPACQTPAGDGQVITTTSEKAVKSQHSVMELLLINHPVDCPVCDQAGECGLQDYAYKYGSACSRFEEDKIKQPKKDIGPHVLLYSDRCIMCTRCVRFTREVTGTGELMIDGRGATESIDVFPGKALDNPLSGCVVDLCPVGALLDKDFLFTQRVWFLKSTPSIDGLTASGDNILVEHNQGEVYRLKPRENMDVNRWWMTDEVRYGWHFINAENRITIPALRGDEAFDDDSADEAWDVAEAAALDGLQDAGHIAAIISPMLSCEDAWHLGQLARAIDPHAVLAVGPVPVDGEDQTMRDGFVIRAEKAPNARGVRRVLEAMGGDVLDAAGLERALTDDASLAGVLVTGNYPSPWVTPSLERAIDGGRFVVQLDTLPNSLTDTADVVLPAATWMEKAGTFESASGRLQTFQRAIAPKHWSKAEAQIAIDLLARLRGESPCPYCDQAARTSMADHGLTSMSQDVHQPPACDVQAESDMHLIVL
ncbi:MAG: molybdopterin-dependent oxidoreductase [Phycisphaerales bacterium]|jgi:NADH-quinone oxidoreductase subunit G|nr:molybdopterin-dependent oxidoreductase [Phycisphaerales bacterium]